MGGQPEAVREEVRAAAAAMVLEEEGAAARRENERPAERGKS